MRIACSLPLNEVVDGSVRYLFNTDEEGWGAVTSGLMYAVHIQRLPPVGRKD